MPWASECPGWGTPALYWSPLLPRAELSTSKVILGETGQPDTAPGTNLGCSLGLARVRGTSGEQMPSRDTIREMKLELEQVFLGPELRPRVGGQTRPSLARPPPALPPQAPHHCRAG